MNRPTLSLVVLPLIALPRLAIASPAYPATLQADLELGSAPSCTVCHATELGGAGTVTTPFGRALLRDGLTGGSNVLLLTSTLGMLDDSEADSDADGISDLDELRMGSDPNEGMVDGMPPDVARLPTPLTGCAALSSTHSPLSFATVGSWLGVLTSLVIGRRRARPRH